MDIGNEGSTQSAEQTFQLTMVDHSTEVTFALRSQTVEPWPRQVPPRSERMSTEPFSRGHHRGQSSSYLLQFGFLSDAFFGSKDASRQ